MQADDGQVEKDIALAFLRGGYPRLAFATVVFKSGARIGGRVSLAAVCIVASMYGTPIELLHAVRQLWP